MNDKKHGKPGHCSTIKWGAIIAGAAIVVGAVLFAPQVMDKIPQVFGSIGDWITGLFKVVPAAAQAAANAAAPTAAEIAKSEAARAAAIEMAKKVGGAALIGGGLAYFMGAKKEPHPQATPEVSESFAMKEDMRKMQALMMMRAAYAGNPEAQAMLQQGRA